MQLRRIDQANILFSGIYFITVLFTTILLELFKSINSNHLVVRTALCFLLSISMMFMSILNYKKRNIFDNKIVESKRLIVMSAFYCIYILFSCMFYIDESMSVGSKDIVSFIMPIGAIAMLTVIQKAIQLSYNTRTKQNAI